MDSPHFFLALIASQIWLAVSVIWPSVICMLSRISDNWLISRVSSENDIRMAHFDVTLSHWMHCPKQILKVKEQWKSEIAMLTWSVYHQILGSTSTWIFFFLEISQLRMSPPMASLCYIHNWANSLKCLLQEFSNSPLYPVMIISYEMFLRSVEEVRNIKFGLIICDEAHRLKNTAIKTATVSWVPSG